MPLLNKKIIAVFLLILLAGAGLSALIWLDGNKVMRIAATLTEESLPRFDTISRLRAALFSQKPILYEYYATTDRQAFLQRYTQAKMETQQAIRSIQAMQNGSPELARIEAGVDRIAWLAKKLDETLGDANTDWDHARELLAEVSDVEHTLQPDIAALVEINQKVVNRSGQTALAYTRSMITMVIGFSVLIFLITLFVGYYANAYIATTAERKRLALFAENSPHPMMRLNWDGGLLYANHASKELARSMRLEDPSTLLPSDLAAKIDRLHVSSEPIMEWEYEHDGRAFQCNLHLLRELQMCHLYLVDITERKRAEQRLTHHAYHDAVTSLPNRSMFHERLDKLLPQATTRKAVAMLMIKPDRIKLVLESQGYTASDQLLAAMAARLRELISQQPALAMAPELFRFEGAAFGVLVPEVEDRELLASIGHHLKIGMLHALQVADREYHFTLSIGAALAPAHGRDADTLFKNAEVVVNRVRAEGGNDFRLFSPELGEQREQTISLERGLRRAIERGELALHYQPQVDLAENRVIGVEALLRWNSKTHGRISPAQFIPLAEEAGLIVSIGHWVLREACLQAQRWSAQNLAPITLAVNISARQLQHPDFVASVGQVLRDTGLDPARLELEITESVAMQDAERTIATLNALRRLGVGLAIDDFGTGFSSLSYLQRFPLDKIKVDQSFVRNITRDDTIALSVILLARSLQLRVIAEGVETRDQVEVLRSHGCEEMQGYYFGRPMPAEEAQELLRPNHRLAIV